jgi:cell division protein ZapA
MAASAKTIEITILGRNYKIACEDGEREALLEAVAYLDGKMDEIKKAGKVSGTDRIAVMAALNIAHELLQLKQTSTQADSAIGGELDALKHRLDAMLAAHAR